MFAFLKYIPARFKKLFRIEFLEKTWKYKQIKLFRAEKLYTAQNYHEFLEAFKTSFTDFVYFCPFRQKEVISSPIHKVRKVYVPRECLRTLAKSRKLDKLQKTTFDFVDLVSQESGISKDDFGVHGSVALGMHTPTSDIDIVVYGSQNFRKLEKTIDKLVEARALSYRFNNRLDAARRFKGAYLDTTFMYNAIRKLEETNERYGQFKYTSVKSVLFECMVENDSEAMFRPAIYRVRDFKPSNKASNLANDRVPQLVVSMIGCYRNVARDGDAIRVAGMLERVENVQTGKVFHQVVVGSGTSEDERIWPL